MVESTTVECEKTWFHSHQIVHYDQKLNQISIQISLTILSCSMMIIIAHPLNKAGQIPGLPGSNPHFLYVSICVSHLLYSTADSFVNVHQSLITLDQVGWLHCLASCFIAIFVFTVVEITVIF